MINPTYTFKLSCVVSDETLTIDVNPNYKDDLSITWEKESQQEFFRRKLSGKLTFQGSECDYILAQPFGTKFTLEIYISYDRGITCSLYWTGFFYLTDCEINEDDKTLIVQPSAKDNYTKLLEGLEKEYDLIPLKPEIQEVNMDKRPMIQIYRSGESAIGCYLSGMWWEEECESVDNITELTDTYHFAQISSQKVVYVSGHDETTLNPNVTGYYYGNITSTNPNSNYSLLSDNGLYKFDYTYTTASQTYTQTWQIKRVSDSAVLWQKSWGGSSGVMPIRDGLIEMTPQSSASGTADALIMNYCIFGRIVCDVAPTDQITTYPLPSDDLVGENRNYNYCQPYNCPQNIFFSGNLSSEPTEYGIYEPGQYFTPPDDIYDYFPIARSAWSRLSMWFYDMDGTARIKDFDLRNPFVLRNAYPLSSVISVLLNQIDTTITHEATADYSQYLYGENTSIEGVGTVMITPKSNIVKAQYDQPAQKAPTTLKSIMDMLRDCFRCYCFIDDEKRFRIEHIRWFMKGGKYVGDPEIGVDLTDNYVSRNGLPWSFNTGKYSFDKPDMTGRYQFEWMDDSTVLFQGEPIDIISPYVNKERVETINVNNFSSDVDYIMLNPSVISLDGFVLLCTSGTVGNYKLPYYMAQWGNSTNLYLQNGLAAFVYLQQLYFYDMPAKKFKVGNYPVSTAFGTKRLKNQSVSFPAYYDIDTTQLVKTAIGNGQIAGATINLLSRQAKVNLHYDTE